MDSLILPSTCNTPAVTFLPDGNLTISGRAISAKAWRFFEPLFDWVNEYTENPAQDTTLNLEFEILHVDSLVKVMDICRLLAQLNKKGFNVSVNWYCEQGDDDMRDMAAMVSELLKSVTINEVMIEKDMT